MNARSQLIRFSVIWLAIFVVCSILSAFSYAEADADPADADNQQTTQKTDKIPHRNPIKNPSTSTPDLPPASNPDTEPEIPTVSPYESLIYSAENANIFIFLDAGHGWNDPGVPVYLTKDGKFAYEKRDEKDKVVKDENGNTIFVTEDGTVVALEELDCILEKDINLAITKKVKKALELMGYRVGETRPGDNPEDCPVPLKENGIYSATDRPDYVNSQNPDYFVSIHCNSMSNNSSVQGTRIYHYETSSSGQKLASKIMTALAEEMGMDTTRHTNNLAITRESNMPTVLIECGFVTTMADLMKLTDPVWQDQFACAVALGLHAMAHAN